MAEFFVSYTSKDRNWAFWIGQQLERLQHVARLHDWEIAAGGDIVRWMEERFKGADHILCVVSEAYLKAPYSSWERRAAQWATSKDRPNFALPVYIERCEPSPLLDIVKHCDLFEMDETPELKAVTDEYMRLAAELWAGTIEPLPGKSLKDREIFDLLGFD